NGPLHRRHVRAGATTTRRRGRKAEGRGGPPARQGAAHVSSAIGRTRPKTEPAPELEPAYDVYARTELRTLALALLASLLLWNLPFGGLLLYPFKLLATWLHELSHGITMILTGAGFDEVLIYRDTSGLAYAHYRIDDAGSAVIAAAGYMGTPLW